MTPRESRRTWQREELLSLLSLSGTMAGLCITGVTLFATGRTSAAGTIADDLLAISAVVFLVCAYAFFFALRSRVAQHSHRWEHIGDSLLAVGLTLMVFTGVVMAYTVW